MIHYLLILQKYKEMETNGPILFCKTHITQYSYKESTHGLKWRRTGTFHCTVLITDTPISLLFPYKTGGNTMFLSTLLARG